MTCVCCNGQSCDERNCVATKFSAAVVTISGAAAAIGSQLCVQNFGTRWVSKLNELNGTYVAPRTSATEFILLPPTPNVFGSVSVAVVLQAPSGANVPCSRIASVSVGLFNIFGAEDCYNEFYVVGVQARVCHAPSRCVNDSTYQYQLASSAGSGSALISLCDGSCIESRAFTGRHVAAGCQFPATLRCGNSPLADVVTQLAGAVTVTLVE